MHPVELTDRRLLLRLPHESDVEAITEACRDPQTQRWIPVPVPYEREHAADWVREAPGCWDADGELRWAVTDAATGGLVGAMSLHARDESMREIGYWTAPPARGRGLTTDAARLACRWGFETLGLARIEWWAAVGNWASRRVAEKVGFTVEGTCRARLLHRGEREDGWVGGLLPGGLR
ncbi:MAG: GNAT family N-acetyltransferase [Actinomycetes bacterium]